MCDTSAYIALTKGDSMEHKTPAGLKAGGRKLWRSVTDDFELGEHELSILVEASRTVDALDALESIVRTEGVTNISPQGVGTAPGFVDSLI